MSQMVRPSQLPCGRSGGGRGSGREGVGERRQGSGGRAAAVPGAPRAPGRREREAAEVTGRRAARQLKCPDLTSSNCKVTTLKLAPVADNSSESRD